MILKEKNKLYPLCFQQLTGGGGVAFLPRVCYTLYMVGHDAPHTPLATPWRGFVEAVRRETRGWQWEVIIGGVVWVGIFLLIDLYAK